MSSLQSDIVFKILNEPKPLSSSQAAAVVSEAKHTRIIAGAGAGKTETLTRRITYLLLVKKVDPKNIVAFTFTEKAASSMKSRVYSRIKELDPELCFKLGDMFIGTIHGYCNRILETEFKHGNYTILDDKQEMAYLMRQGWHLNFGDGFYSTNCETFLRSLNVVYGELIDEKILKAKDPKFYEKMTHYEEMLEEHKCLTFNLLINKTVKCLEEKPSVADKVLYLIVDEYQDINRAQEKLIQLLGNNGNIFIVGDPRQTIYQWRGSDDACFEDFVKYYPDTETIRILENRRSSIDVIESANSFADTIKDQKYNHMIPTKEEKGGFFVLEVEDTEEEVKWIGNEIKRIVESGKCHYRDIALLFRSVTTSAPIFIDYFRDMDIPYVIGGRVGLFRRPEIKALGMIFCWLDENGFWQDDRYDFKSKIIRDHLIDEADNLWIEGMKISLPREELEKWKSDIYNKKYGNFTEIYQALLQILDFQSLNPNDPKNALIMANMGRFNELLSDFETPNSFGGRSRKWKSDLHNLCWYINTFASSQYEEQSGDERSVVDAVQLMTIHQSKGLEWSLVFIPSMVKKRFPSAMTGKPQKWMFSDSLISESTKRRYNGSDDSERKLMYVAMTRAKDYTVCSYFSRRNGRNVSKSDFIGDIVAFSDHVKLTTESHLPGNGYSTSFDSDEIETFSVTDIITYNQCPQKYLFRIIWGFQPGLTEMLGYGTMLHFCLQEAARLVVDEEYSPVFAVRTAVEENFHMPFISGKVRNNVLNGAVNALSKFAMKCGDDFKRVREVETHVEFPLQKAILTGQVDVILHESASGIEGIEVRDYKTSDRVITKEDLATQIQLYTYALTSTGENVVKGSVAYIEDSRVDIVDVCTSACVSAISSVEKTIENIRTGIYGKCSGNACSVCDYKNICPKEV